MNNALLKIRAVPDETNTYYILFDENDNKVCVPESVAIILDGNGRYAEKKGISRAEGHRAGCTALESILEESVRINVKFLTVYAFSTENWKRSETEINALFDLFFLYLDKISKKAKENNVRVNFIGDIYKFPDRLYKQCEKLMHDTKDNDRMVFSIAFNYGSRDEMVRAMRRMYADVDDPSEITEERFRSYLDTADIPDPDLLIRTSGEQRLSNFLLWQLAYAEFYFTPVDWPDFTEKELKKAVDTYRHRNRRYGKV